MGETNEITETALTAGRRRRAPEGKRKQEPTKSQCSKERSKPSSTSPAGNAGLLEIGPGAKSNAKKRGAPAEPERNETTTEENAQPERKIKPLTQTGQRRLVSRLLGKADREAEGGDLKISASDVIRLIQVQNELSARQPRKMTVEWIEDGSE